MIDHIACITLHSVSSSMDRGCFCICPDFRLKEKSNRPVVTLLQRTNNNTSHKIRPPKTLFIYDPESKMFFAITPEIRLFGNFIYY